MQNWIAFVFSVFVILIAPGPTNVLLATAAGSRARGVAATYLLAQAAGYALAIGLARLALQVIPASQPTIQISLHFAVAAYLALLAARLWRFDQSALRTERKVTPRNVFITTFLNPKALIFAYGVLPFGGDGAWLYFLTLVALTTVSGSFWMAAGAHIAAAAPAILFRGCSGALGVFAAAICISAFL